MGSSASVALGEGDFELPTDVKTAKEQIETIKAQIAEEASNNQSVASFFRTLLDSKLPDENDDLDAWQEYRLGLFHGVERYRALVTPVPPTSVEEIIERSGENVNLSSADEDDDGKAGSLYVFRLNPIQVVPLKLFETQFASAIVSLTLKKNGLATIPDQISTLLNLTTLDLSENSLQEFPQCITSLVNLESLNLSENALPEIPSSIEKLSKLTTLILFKNAITTLPDEFGNCIGLEEVNLFNNKLTKIPATLANLEALVDINIGGNKLKTIPSTKKWNNLERLALSWNCIVMLNDFGGMPKLKQLQLGRNQLETIDDDAFADMSEIETIDISSNRLTAIPSSIGSCTTCQVLNLSSNMLSSIISLEKLGNLEILNLGSNKLADVTDGNIEKCTTLQTLFLQDNSLQTLPAELVNLQNLTRVNVAKNPELASAIAPIREKLKPQCLDAKGRWIE